ncbi:unnamed protein product [Amaranthus hypochondriacus]
MSYSLCSSASNRLKELGDGAICVTLELVCFLIIRFHFPLQCIMVSRQFVDCFAVAPAPSIIFGLKPLYVATLYSLVF